jgi:hypothetical protein
VINLIRSASISVLFAVLVWLIGLGAVVLLWRKESSGTRRQENQALSPR